MSKSCQNPKSSPDKLACRLLKSEHEALVRWLHDDLGQNLIAIKSFSAAIKEQPGRDDDTQELASFINDAAESAFRATYDLMQELRAGQLASQPVKLALSQCVQESGLKEKNITSEVDIDSLIDELNYTGKSIILRSVREFINRCKLIESISNIRISLRQLIDPEQQTLELRLEHNGPTNCHEAEGFDFEHLGNRTNAINGEMFITTDSEDKFILSLRFDRYLFDVGSIE